MNTLSTIADSVNARYRALSSSARASSLFALVFVTIPFALATLAWSPNGVYDDWSISNALSARWGDPQGLCLFLNAGLCYVIYYMNSIFTSINWFYVFERLTAYASIVAIVYIALRHLKLPFFSIVTFGVFVLLMPGCTYESNFTYVAGTAVCAGGFALLCSLGSKRHGIGLLVLGWTLLMVGAAWRWSMFLLCVPIIGIAALMIALAPESLNLSVIRRLGRLWPYGIAIILFAGLYLYNGSVWSASPWSDWYAFNEVRSDISDYTYQSYDDFSEGLSSIGVSENDYAMLKSWMTEDTEFFTTERLINVKDVITSKRSDVSRIAESVIPYLKDVITSARIDALFVSLLLAIGLCTRGRKRWCAASILFGTLVLCWALYAFGRLPARVSLPVWMYAAVSIGALTAFVGMNEPAGSHAQPAAMGKRGFALSHGQAFGTVFSVLPAIAFAFILAMGATNLRTDRLVAILDEDAFTPENYLTKYLDAHEDNLYALNIASTSSLVYANLMIEPLDEYTIGHMTSLGGWAARAPYAVARNKRIGMENPIKDLVNNSRAYYIAPGPSSADSLKTFLREHYYPHADYEQVDVIENASNANRLFVYRFHKS